MNTQDKYFKIHIHRMKQQVILQLTLRHNMLTGKYQSRIYNTIKLELRYKRKQIMFYL